MRPDEEDATEQLLQHLGRGGLVALMTTFELITERMMLTGPGGEQLPQLQALGRDPGAIVRAAREKAGYEPAFSAHIPDAVLRRRTARLDIMPACRRRVALRKRRRSPGARAPRVQTPATLIHDRPVVVELRERVGDWEGDLVVGRGNKSAVATLVDRRTRLLRLIPLPDGHDSAKVCGAIAAALEALPETARMTLTWDQGIECRGITS